MNSRRLAFCAFYLLCAAPSLPPVSKAQQRKKPKSCRDTALTQVAMNECAAKEMQAAEARLTALLKNLGIGPEDPGQKAWEVYRDAQIEAIYPNPKENIAQYGSVYPMCFALLKAKLAEGRIRDLKALTSSGEGDVCFGLNRMSREQGLKPAMTARAIAKAEVEHKPCNLASVKTQ